MFKNPFSFDGRIRRLEFGISYIIYVFGTAILQLFAASLGEDNALGILIMIAVFVPLAWFLLAQGAKRCHDRGNSGWYQLIPFYVLWMLFADGDIGKNEYGLNPKGIGNYNEINEIGTKEAI